MKRLMLSAIAAVAVLLIGATTQANAVRAALTSDWVGNLLRFHTGATTIMDIDGDNTLVDIKSLKLNGTAVTATAANLNAVPTATGTGLEIDAQTKDVCSSASTVTLSTSAAVQTATITCNDADGNTVATPQALEVYLADDATGATVSTAAANGTVAFTTGSLLKADTAKLVFRVMTSTGGVAVLSIDNTGGTDHYAHYVVLVLPNRKVKVSAVTDVRSS